MKNLARNLLILIFIFQVFETGGQDRPGRFYLEGFVHGYEKPPLKGFLQKSRPLVLEGKLDSARLTIYQEGQKTLTEYTDGFGEFSISLDFDNLYRLVVSKPGFNKNVLWVDTRAIPDQEEEKEIIFKGVDFFLNSFQGPGGLEQDEVIGRLYFNPAINFFDLDQVSAKEKKRNEPDNLVSLLEKAIEKNRKWKPVPSKEQEEKSPVSMESPIPGEKIILSERKDTLTISNDFELSFFRANDDMSEDAIVSREGELRRARDQLEQDRLVARTTRDSLVLKIREQQIVAGERELASAKTLIEVQDSELKAQRKSLEFLGMALALLVILLIVAYFFYREKIHSNRLLTSKNRKILDSINYAKRIQQATLLTERSIRKFIPESFVFFKPKEIVSGDFYWFHQLNGKIIVAVGDCTGHGVPGAFMSLIGNTLLNEIIIDKKIVDPAQVLKSLDHEVKEILHKQTQNPETSSGMEIAVCLLDRKQKTMRFAGAMNSLYLFNGQKVEVIRGDLKLIAGNLPANGSGFTNHQITLNQGDSVYMCTDGYVDQFGGLQNQKFNRRRFKNLLLSLKKNSMNEQKDIIEKTMLDWKGPNPQTDDILVLGFKVNF